MKKGEIMKVGILAGGLGTRLSEETVIKPKPMVEIGGKPILWHIMKIYSHYGFNDFVIALGYRGEIIKEYFANYYLRMSNFTVNCANGALIIHNTPKENWSVRLLDTGVNTMTGGRIKQISEHIGDEPFMLTYGDGVADIDVNKLLQSHENSGKIVTVTAVNPPARFGEILFDENGIISDFAEKYQTNDGWINGGFFVIDPEAIKYIDDNQTVWEREPMEFLADEHKISAYKHTGFWQCMDTIRDVQLLNRLWETDPKWKVWNAD